MNSNEKQEKNPFFWTKKIDILAYKKDLGSHPSRNRQTNREEKHTYSNRNRQANREEIFKDNKKTDKQTQNKYLH